MYIISNEINNILLVNCEKNIITIYIYDFISIY